MSVQLSPLVMQRFYDNNNNPLVGGQLFTYQAGTTIPQATYTDSTGSTANPNPVIMNARGEAPVWMLPTQSYKLILKDAAGNTIWTCDNVVAPAPVAVGNMTDEKGRGGTFGFAANVDFTPGTTTTLTLSTNYGSASNLWVAFDGAEQGADTYSLAGTTLTFTSPIPSGINKVYVKGGTSLTIGTPNNGTVTDASVAGNAAINSSKLSFLQTGVGSIARTVQSKLGDIISVKDFGAVGDGVTNDTAAVQAAINCAQNAFKTDFWSTYVPKVYMPSGNYLVSGLIISAPIHLFGDGQNGTAINLANSSNTSVISITDMGATLAGADVGNIMPIISDMSIGCNGSGQGGSGFSRGISISDASVPVTTSYHGGAEIWNVNIRAAQQYSVYIGTNRNNGRMVNVRTLYAGSDSVFSNGYDWRFETSDFGNSQGGNGFTQNSGGAAEFFGCNIFDNTLSGLFINTGVNASCLFEACYLDTNMQHGFVAIGSYGDIVSHSFVNCVWRDNSQQADNSYDHINLSNQGQVTIEGCTFVVNNQAKQPRYLVNTSNVVRVVFNATYEQNDTPNVPYHTAITNNFLILAVGGNENCSFATLGNSTVGVVGLSGARFDMYDSASTSTQRRWRTQAAGSTLPLLTSDDAGVTTSLIAQVTRTGNTPNAIQTISVQPYSDNVFPSGSASFRWSVIYAGTGTINTSDENEKTDIASIDDAVLDAWADVDYYTFKFKDAIATKGDAARTHFGMVAQRVGDAFKKHGLDATHYGLLCYDEWEAESEILDEEGKIVRPAVLAGGRWGVRYDQAMILEAALLRREIKSLKGK